MTMLSRPPGLRVLALALASILVSGTGAAAVPAQDGLYAVFRIRRGDVDRGEFTCRLAYDKVPRTVASFVGLAEGRRTFVDFKNGHAVQRPFYDGITFHRVVAGFVIQGGSPNGLGNDGPGYVFRDEFDASLRHSKAGILSMANSGAHSNGSQFFVTLAPTAWLDDVHNVFGEVVEGLNVVTNVAQGDVIASLRIVRQGAAAQAFPVQHPTLPEVTSASASLRTTASGVSRLDYQSRTNAEHFVFQSDRIDAPTWTESKPSELVGPEPGTDGRDVSAWTTGKPSGFFEVTRVQYPDPLLTPVSLASRPVELVDAGGFRVALSLTATNTGTYTFTQGANVIGPHPVSGYSWGREPYRGRLEASISGLAAGGTPIVRLSAVLLPLTLTNGTYTGSFSTLLGQSISLKGSYSVAGP